MSFFPLQHVCAVSDTRVFFCRSGERVWNVGLGLDSKLS